MGKGLKKLVKEFKKENKNWEEEDLCGLLTDAQEVCGGSLDKKDQKKICKKLDLKRKELKEIMKDLPEAKSKKETHELRVCNSKKCQSKDKEGLKKYIEETYGKSDTVSYKTCGCLHKCKDGPCVKLDGKIYTEMTPEKLKKLIGA